MDNANSKATLYGTLVFKRNAKLRDLHDCANKLQAISHQARNLADAIDGFRPETQHDPTLRVVNGQIQRLHVTTGVWIAVDPPDPEIAKQELERIVELRLEIVELDGQIEDIENE